jgi:hypothetical protein
VVVRAAGPTPILPRKIIDLPGRYDLVLAKVSM